MIKLVYAALFFLFGVAALWAGTRVSGDIKKNRGWPTVPGKILERRLGEPMTTRNRSVMPYVKYTYVVEGKEYTNDQVYLIKRSGGAPTRMQKLVDGLPDPIPVHYDPANPSQSYLLTNPTSTTWTLAIFGGFAILMGAAQLLMYWYKRKGGS